MRTFLNRLGSIKFTLALLLLLAGLAAFGTFLPRGPGLETWVRILGTTGTRAAVFLGLTDFYHSLWFASLLAALAVNILACMGSRVPGMLSSLSGSAALGRAPVVDLPDSEENRSKVLGALGSMGFRGTGRGNRSVFNRGASGYVFTVLTHGSVLVIMAFSVFGSTAGFISTQRIYVGDSTSTAYDWNAGQDRPLPFEVRVEDFAVVPNPIGLRLGVLEVGTRSKGGVITTHVGGTFEVPGIAGRFKVESFDTGEKDFQALWTRSDGSRLRFGREEEIGDTGYSLVPVAFASWPERQAVARVTLVPGQGEPGTGEISVNHPMVSRGIRIYLTDYGQDRFGLPYVGFQFVRDPGQAGVWIGCVLFLACVTGAVFIRHSCAVLASGDGRLRVHISSREDREGLVQRLVDSIKEQGPKGDTLEA